MLNNSPENPRSNPPYPPFTKGRKLISPFEKGGLRGIFIAMTIHLPKQHPRMRPFYFSYLLRCAARYNLTAAVTALRSEVYNIVCILDYILVMFDDHHAVSCINQLVQHIKELLNICKMQPCRRFIKYIEGAARCPPG